MIIQHASHQLGWIQCQSQSNLKGTTTPHVIHSSAKHIMHHTSICDRVHSCRAEPAIVCEYLTKAIHRPGDTGISAVISLHNILVSS